MKWGNLLKLFKNQPIIETFMLTSDVSELSKTRVQLSRWVKSGKLLKIRNGFYMLPDDYRASPSDLEYVSTFIHRPSYISLEYALASYNLIPEMVPNPTLITTKRPWRLQFKNHLFIYRHIQPELFWGYAAKGERNYETFLAEPEKAILDLFYFAREKISDSFFEEMRFQNTEELDLKKIMKYAKRFNSRKILKFAELFCRFAGASLKMGGL